MVLRAQVTRSHHTVGMDTCHLGRFYLPLVASIANVTFAVTEGTPSLAVQGPDSGAASQSTQQCAEVEA